MQNLLANKKPPSFTHPARVSETIADSVGKVGRRESNTSDNEE
jgi:hypothetical protein